MNLFITTQSVHIFVLAKIICILAIRLALYLSPTADELEFLRNAYYHIQNQDGSFLINIKTWTRKNSALEFCDGLSHRSHLKHCIEENFGGSLRRFD
ncbi:hypothetical protein RCL_jg13683.t1 [Rhizophagus clarus]|uniref:Uncharacterized protein n=1 Tax=Rhizophagus clarus TaxID=94130 RepID=A0A8H3MD62_9GLOM|nr:hypothetical protein RCL_jg13683.t1 [Rhizophagus clarus]